MNSFKRIAVVLLCGSSLLPAQHKKKPGVSALFESAHYVYVQAQDGDVTNPRLFPQDRQAISDVEDALRAWHRYALAINASQADLIVVVRKGRLAELQGHGGVGDGPRPMPPMGPGQSPSQKPSQGQDPDQIGARSEVGPDTDLLRVYGSNGEGKRTGPIWTGEKSDGLDGPAVPLVQQLRSAVENAYPNPPQQQKP